MAGSNASRGRRHDSVGPADCAAGADEDLEAAVLVVPEACVGVHEGAAAVTERLAERRRCPAPAGC